MAWKATAQWWFSCKLVLPLLSEGLGEAPSLGWGWVLNILLQKPSKNSPYFKI